MKQILLLSSLLLINFTIAQEVFVEKLQANFQFSKNNIEINHYSEQPLNSAYYADPIDRFVFNDSELNTLTENKFAIKTKNLETYEKSILEKNMNKNKNQVKKDMLWLVSNLALIDAIIASNSIENGFIDSNFAPMLDLYGDQNIEIYRNYSTILFHEAGYTLSEKPALKIGNNILPFVNKKFKTTLEKNLFSSLNFMVMNF